MEDDDDKDDKDEEKKEEASEETRKRKSDLVEFHVKSVLILGSDVCVCNI